MPFYFTLNSPSSAFVRTQSLTTLPQRTAVSVPLPQHTTALSSVIMPSSSKFETLNVQGTNVYFGGYQRKVGYGDHRTILLTFYSLMVTWCTNKFNIQQSYTSPTLHSCVLYLSVNKQRLVPLTA